MEKNIYSYEYCQQIYVLWKNSGLNAHAFCSQDKSYEYALRKWRKKFNQHTEALESIKEIKFLSISDKAKTFVIANEVKQSSNHSYENQSQSVIEVISSNGIIIKMTLNKQEAINLIKELLQWK